MTSAFFAIFGDDDKAGVTGTSTVRCSVALGGNGSQLAGVAVDDVVTATLAEEGSGIAPQIVQCPAMHDRAGDVGNALALHVVR